MRDREIGREAECEHRDAKSLGGTGLTRWCQWAVVGLVLLTFLAPIALAQTASSLNGRIVDPSGAAVPKATITLTDNATGAVRTTTSNGQGLYEFFAVPPGNYSLQATAAGFSAYLAQHVTLLVSTPSTVNITLGLAKVASEVVVHGNAVPLINSTDASLGNVIENDQLAQLPIAGRDVANLLSLQAGVVYLGSQLNTSITDTRSGASNGLRSDQNNITLDGADINDVNNGFAFTGVLSVPIDSVEEYRVTTANANATSGYSSGAQEMMVTKSGTNAFHGSLYEYNRNTMFSANDPFLKAAQLTNGQPNKAPELKQNFFGGTIGGPILHNRLFFFANYEGRRDAVGASVERSVPTASLKDGVIQYLCATAAQCPGGTVQGNSGTIYNVAPGNFALAQSDLKGMDPQKAGADPAVLTMLQQYPNPNDPTIGDGLNLEGYRFSSNQDSRYDTFITRLDYHITPSGSETIFWRGQMQNNKLPGEQEFPGQIGATTLLDGSKASIVGLTSVISPTKVNTFHWDLIRQADTNAGASLLPEVILSGVSQSFPSTRSTSYIVPVNEFNDNLNWIRGNHALSLGTNLFIIRDNRTSYAKSFSDASMNLAYLNTTGIVCTSNLSSPLNPSNNTNPATSQPYPAVDPNFGCTGYDASAMLLYGILAQGDGFYNYTPAGTALAQGTPVRRNYALNDYEFYGQDAWRVTPNLTFTYGLRYLLEAPPTEENGAEVIPCVLDSSNACTGQHLSDWMNKSAELAKQGMPTIDAGELGFFLGGPKNHGPGFWNWDYQDFSPRLAVAWTPDPGEGWLSKILGRKNEFSIRGGYSIVFDHYGMPIVNTFDQNGSFGLTSDIGDAAGAAANTVQALPRFTCPTCLPPPCPSIGPPGCILQTAPPGGFPVIPSNSNFAINWGLDSSLKTPYAHEFNLTLTRQFGQSSSLQIAYVGTVGRRLSMEVDEAMPTDLNDKTSGMDYFKAATLLSQEVAQGLPTSQVQPIPYWENLFPAWSGITQSFLDGQGLNCIGDDNPGALTATQALYDFWSCNEHNETFGLFILDTPSSVSGFSVPNSKFGPYAFYHDQFSSLTAWRNIGTSDYNALQVTYNVRWRDNLTSQFNYTFSKSLDEVSDAGRIGAWEGSGGTGNDDNGGGIVINTWSPLSLRGLSSFNAFNQINANWVYRLPFGKGQMLAGNASSWLNEFIGGWQFSGLFRWTTGFPTSIDNGGFWPTNWNIEGLAMPLVNGKLPKVSNHGAEIFADPAAAEADFRHSWPGESGTRDEIIGDGMFDIDTGLAKDFSLGESRKLEFSWQTFNVTNAVRFDVQNAIPTLRELPSQFGRYTNTMTQPRFMQFALRFAF
ncbi:MAG TPA: carboxypeptidase-like regulatory domain-containing protein [Candidatus Acidoferrales bacterium]|nr:carboxypeptidase-like regulatory domain-containing protein [Candidatus Acidoferrales bacterium]